MKIVLFHPERIPPKDYGGVERVVYWLAKGLAERGHQVWMGALEGSVPPPGVELLPFTIGDRSAHALLPRLPAGIDCVHFMAPPEAGVLQQLPCNYLITIHGNGQPGERFPSNTVFLSANHALRHGFEGRFVHNGLDPAQYCFDPKQKKNWLLFLSKTSWKVKNVRFAIDLCRQTQLPLKVAGGRRPLWQRARVLQAHWFGANDWQWLGWVGGEQKSHLLAEARAFLFPVLWEEPFGLAAIEALVSGTPVYAFHRGSLPEIVTDAVGKLFHSEQEWVDFFLSSEHWKTRDPELCRQRVLDFFHYRQMAEKYEFYYQEAGKV